MNEQRTTDQIVPIGCTVKVGPHSWRVGAVGFVGERYYWLTRGRNDVAMWPASVVETAFREQNNGK